MLAKLAPARAVVARLCQDTDQGPVVAMLHQRGWSCSHGLAGTELAARENKRAPAGASASCKEKKQEAERPSDRPHSEVHYRPTNNSLFFCNLDLFFCCPFPVSLCLTTEKVPARTTGI